MASRNPLGLARGDPGEDAVEMSADHCGDFFHLLDLRAQHVAAPAVEQEACNVWLLAGEDLAQVLAVLPGACGAGRGHLCEQPIALRALCGGERGAILQQPPALAPEARVELLLDAAHLVDGFRGMGDDVERVEGDLGIGQMLADSANAGRGPIDTDHLDLGWRAVMSTQLRLERLEQQREAGEPAAPGRGDLHDLAVGQLHPRKAHLELALVLEEVQVPVGLGDRVVHRMHPCLRGYGKTAADLGIDPAIERPRA